MYLIYQCWIYNERFCLIDALRPSQQLRSGRDVASFTQNEDVMTSNKCLKYNHTTKPQKGYMYGWFDLNHVSWTG